MARGAGIVSRIVVVLVTALATAIGPIASPARAENHEEDEPVLGIAKVADDPEVAAGDTVAYTITVTNTGDGDAVEVALEDLLPPEHGLAPRWEITVDGWGTCDLDGPNLDCTAEEIEPSESREVRVAAVTDERQCGVIENSASVEADNHDEVETPEVPIEIVCPELSVTKTADDAEVIAGQQAGYTIEVENPERRDARDLMLRDELPNAPGVDWSIESTEGPLECDIVENDGQVLECDGDLDAGERFRVHVVTDTSEETCDERLRNEAIVTRDEEEESDEIRSGVVDIDVICGDPALIVRKTTGRGIISAGQQIGYLIEVENVGLGTAETVSMRDLLPRMSNGWERVEDIVGFDSCGMSNEPANDASSPAHRLLRCRGSDLDPGETMSVRVGTTTTREDCGTVANVARAWIAADQQGGVESEEVLVQILCARLEIVKDPLDPAVDAGETIGYRITVGATRDGVTDLVMTDVLPAGFDWEITDAHEGWDCEIDGRTLRCTAEALGGEDELWVIVEAETDAEDCGVVENEARAEAEGAEPVETREVEIDVDCPDGDGGGGGGGGGQTLPQQAATLTIAKTPDAAAVTAPAPIGFTMVVTNEGPGSASNVTMSDTLPAFGGAAWALGGVTGPATCSIAGGTLGCTAPLLPAGTSFSARVTTPTGTGACGAVANTASVSGGGTATASVDVACPQASLSLTETGPEFGHVFETELIALSLTSAGAPVSAVVVAEPVCDAALQQTGGDDGDAVLEPGETWTYSCEHVVTASDPDPLVHSATADGADPLGRPVHADATRSMDILHPSMSLDASVSPDSGSPGDEIAYTYTVTNTSSDSTLFDVSVDDEVWGHIGDAETLPFAAAGRGARGFSVAAGASVTFENVVTLGDSAIRSTATAVAHDASGTEATVEASDSTEVTVVRGILIDRGGGGDRALPRTGWAVRDTAVLGWAVLGLGVGLVGRSRRGRRRAVAGEGPALGSR